MGLLEFFNSQPSVTIYTPTQFNATNPSGMARQDLKAGRLVKGRLLEGSGNQQLGWAQTTLPAKSDYRFLTFDKQIGNGDVIVTQDSRTFRVTGVGKIVYAAGTLPTQLSYPLEQIIRRTSSEYPTAVQ